MKLAEFQVTHRDLYTPTDRVPVKDGVLDRRLVCPLTPDSPKLFEAKCSANVRERPRRVLSARLAVFLQQIVLATTRILSYRSQYFTLATSSIQSEYFSASARCVSVSNLAC